MSMMSTTIRNAQLICLSEEHPDPVFADIRIKDGKITAIGRLADASDSEDIDATGHLIIPGLVNAHMHTWQSALRGIAVDLVLPDYLKQVHGIFAPKYSAQDIAAATLVGALNQLNCGTTTLGDWCHNNRTPEHSDAAIDALRSAGSRAVFFNGFPQVDPRGHTQDITTLFHNRDELERLRSGPIAQCGDLISLGMAVLGPHYSTMEAAIADLTTAKDLGLVASMHHSGGAARSTDGWDQVERLGLLGSNTNIVHGNTFSTERLKVLTDLGVSFTVTPEVEMAAGHGYPITGRLIEAGGSPSLGVDIESGISGDMISVARLALAQQRALDHASARESNAPMAPLNRLTAKDALTWLTVNGAKALGLENKVGRLACGLQADLVMIDTRTIGLVANLNPYSAVLNANSTDIAGVMIAGQWKKLRGKLLASGLEQVFENLAESRLRLTGI
jgi:5-methylthioadenosine/S-adenosylhomocysteine deaminase